MSFSCLHQSDQEAPRVKQEMQKRRQTRLTNIDRDLKKERKLKDMLGQRGASLEHRKLIGRSGCCLEAKQTLLFLLFENVSKILILLKSNNM